jgi:hypothetical protein
MKESFYAVVVDDDEGSLSEGNIVVIDSMIFIDQEGLARALQGRQWKGVAASSPDQAVKIAEEEGFIAELVKGFDFN